MTSDPAHPRLWLPSRALVYPLGIGLAVRCGFLLLGGTMQLSFDEVLYLRIGTTLHAEGTYNGWWPPGYAAVIAVFLELFGSQAIAWLRLFQVLCSAAIGWGVIQMAHHLFGERGALLSGYAWAVYLPLAYFTHHLWSETLFLALFVPSIYVLTCFLTSTTVDGWRWKLALAGVCFAGALYLKESPLYLAPVLSVLLLVRRPRAPWVTALAFPLAVATVLSPLVVRNYLHFDRVVLVGWSLGQNVRWGLNADYVNHDYNRDPELVRRVHEKDGEWDFVGRHFILYGPGWETSRAPNPIDRAREDLRSAMAYASGRPMAFLRTRIKRLADFFTPLSFVIRDVSPEVYSGPVGSHAGLRRLVISLALISAPALLILSWIQLIRLRDHRWAFLVFVTITGYFTLTAMLISMSRFRAPMEPFLLTLIGGMAVSRSESGRRWWTTRVAAGTGVLVLGLLWLLNLSEVGQVLARSWG